MLFKYLFSEIFKQKYIVIIEMRTPEQNSIYMSKYMKAKYAANIEESRKKTLENYYRNKHSKINKNKKINKHINNLTNEIELMVQNNKECDDELIEASENLMLLVDIIHKHLDIYICKNQI